MKAYVVCRTCGTCVEKCDIHLHAEKCKQPKEYQATHTVVNVPRSFLDNVLWVLANGRFSWGG